MNRKQRILNLLSKQFDQFSISIIDNSYLHVGHNKFDGLNETHIQILLISKTSQKINRMDIHKKINYLLKNKFEIGLHSLEIKIN